MVDAHPSQLGKTRTSRRRLSRPPRRNLCRGRSRGPQENAGNRSFPLRSQVNDENQTWQGTVNNLQPNTRLRIRYNSKPKTFENPFMNRERDDPLFVRVGT